MKGENTMNSKIKDFLRKYTMVIALVIVFILFCALTDGRLLFAQNMSNLMLQNGYVLVLACGMLLCILTGGNIDLSVGSVICFVGGVAAVLIGSKGFNPSMSPALSAAGISSNISGINPSTRALSSRRSCCGTKRISSSMTPPPTMSPRHCTPPFMWPAWMALIS